MGSCTSHDVKEADVLHVVSVVFNPAGFEARTELFRKFKQEVVKKRNAVFWTVECVFGDQEFQVTTEGNSQDIRLKAPQKLWLKENLINIAAERFLPADWKYMAWVDADILFTSEDIMLKTIAALKQAPIVQMFETVQFLGPSDEVLEENKSFGYYRTAMDTIDPSQYDKAYPHPGFAWAITREAYDAIGGLPDFSIVGNCDNHLAYAMIKRVKESVPRPAVEKVSPGYWQRLTKLEDALVAMQGSRSPLGPGYVKGEVIKHMWHGDWKDRGYVRRWDCLVVDGVTYDPNVHMAYERNGVVVVTDSRFLKAVEEYFVSRKEDSKTVVTDHKNKHKKSLPSGGGGGGGGHSGGGGGGGGRSSESSKKTKHKKSSSSGVAKVHAPKPLTDEGDACSSSSSSSSSSCCLPVHQQDDSDGSHGHHGHEHLHGHHHGVHGIHHHAHVHGIEHDIHHHAHVHGIEHGIHHHAHAHVHDHGHHHHDQDHDHHHVDAHDHEQFYECLDDHVHHHHSDEPTPDIFSSAHNAYC